MILQLPETDTDQNSAKDPLSECIRFPLKYMIRDACVEFHTNFSR
jgi:hypothetical protein